MTFLAALAFWSAVVLGVLANRDGLLLTLTNIIGG